MGCMGLLCCANDDGHCLLPSVCEMCFIKELRREEKSVKVRVTKQEMNKVRAHYKIGQSPLEPDLDELCSFRRRKGIDNASRGVQRRAGSSCSIAESSSPSPEEACRAVICCQRQIYQSIAMEGQYKMSVNVCQSGNVQAPCILNMSRTSIVFMSRICRRLSRSRSSHRTDPSAEKKVRRNGDFAIISRGNRPSACSINPRCSRLSCCSDTAR